MNKIFILYENPYEGTFVEIFKTLDHAQKWLRETLNDEKKKDYKVLFIVSGIQLKMNLTDTLKKVQVIKYKTVKLECNEDGEHNSISPTEENKF